MILVTSVLVSTIYLLVQACCQAQHPALAPAAASCVPPVLPSLEIHLWITSHILLLALASAHVPPQMPFQVSYLLTSLFSATKSSHTIQHWASRSACRHFEHLARLPQWLWLCLPHLPTTYMASLALEAWSVSSRCRGLAVSFSGLQWCISPELVGFFPSMSKHGRALNYARVTSMRGMYAYL